ncbi:MAG TPA: ABC transporter substrate-binding protein [Chloroflexota bacterium]|jgi:ABC-type nitrate/sulfonate/bicarbonate transport system substrate-binding protein
MRLAVSDVVSPSYFVATAAVELGFFEAEGLDVEFVPQPGETPVAFRSGAIDFVGGSPYTSLVAFPEWKGAKLLCALSQYTYWFLAMRADLGVRRGDLSAVKGRRISAAGRPGLTLKHLLEDAGLDLERDRIEFVTPPQPPGNWARVGADAIEQDLADGFWGNGMRVEYAVRRGVATVLLDVRRGDGPPASRRYTFPALITTDRLIEEHPEAAAGAVRAIVKTQRALRADPSLATRAAQRLFPAEEKALIAELIARDAEFYDPTISEESVRLTSQFAQDLGLLSGPVAYEDVVATQFAHLWSE